MLQHCIVFTYKNSLNLIEKILYIINDRYNEVMYAKYCRPRMNDACTVCSGQLCQPPCRMLYG